MDTSYADLNKALMSYTCEDLCIKLTKLFKPYVNNLNIRFNSARDEIYVDGSHPISSGAITVIVLSIPDDESRDELIQDLFQNIKKDYEDYMNSRTKPP